MKKIIKWQISGLPIVIILILIIVLMVLFKDNAFTGSADYDYPCRQWEGKHQAFDYLEIEGRKYIRCNSCGDLIRLRNKG